jgi:hypothetical protein
VRSNYAELGEERKKLGKRVLGYLTKSKKYGII